MTHSRKPRQQKSSEGGFVYRWTNSLNGNVYVGSHKGLLDDGYVGSGKAFRKAVDKYGLDVFKRDILYIGSDFRKEEDRVLKELLAAGGKNCYNLKFEATGGAFFKEKNGMYGKKHTTETKKKTGDTLSTGERWGSKRKHKKHSLLMKGKRNPMYGVSRKGSFAIIKATQTRKTKKEEWGFLLHSNAQKSIFKKIYFKLARKGQFSFPRSLKVIECENFAYSLPPYVRFANFECRNLKVSYVKKEFLWYLKGDRFDVSIVEHAALWTTIKNKDNSINSNYGQYIFGKENQFDRVVTTLAADRDSRRASICILNRDHLFSDTRDVPCTYSMNFRIRNNELRMSVHMRSQDAIYGMGNDIPAFSFIHEMMLNSLRRYYPELQYGEYHHIVDSFHVYEKHFKMLEQITGLPVLEPKQRKVKICNSYSLVLCPKISGYEEVDFLRRLDFTEIPSTYKFTKWLLEK